MLGQDGLAMVWESIAVVVALDPVALAFQTSTIFILVALVD